MNEDEIEERITSMIKNVLKDDSDNSKSLDEKNKNSETISPPVILVNNIEVDTTNKKFSIPDIHQMNNLCINTSVKKNLTHEIPNTNMNNLFENNFLKLNYKYKLIKIET